MARHMLAFESPHLQLRPLGDGDGALYCQLYTDIEVMRHIGAPLSPAAAERSFGAACRLAARGGLSTQRWVIFEHGSSAALGLLALLVDDSNNDEAEIGVMLLAEGQRRGVGMTAIGMVADRVFDVSRAHAADPLLRLLWTRHAADNLAATGLMLRMGFVRRPNADITPHERRWQLTREHWTVASSARGMEKRDENR